MLGVASGRGHAELVAVLGRRWACSPILHATHDIACDGFYLQALDRKGQALYAGTRIAAFRVAMIVGSSLLVVLAGRTSWQIGFGAAGVLMLLTAAVELLR